MPQPYFFVYGYLVTVIDLRIVGTGFVRSLELVT